MTRSREKVSEGEGIQPRESRRAQAWKEGSKKMSKLAQERSWDKGAPGEYRKGFWPMSTSSYTLIFEEGEATSEARTVTPTV